MTPLSLPATGDQALAECVERCTARIEAGEALETVPTLRMLTEPPAAIRRRARGLLRRLPAQVQTRLGMMLVEATSEVGGGALPTVELPTAALDAAGAGAMLSVRRRIAR